MFKCCEKKPVFFQAFFFSLRGKVLRIIRVGCGLKGVLIYYEYDL